MNDIERETAPPPHLKERVLDSLKNRGLLHRPGPPSWLRIAAMLVILLPIGFVAGRLGGGGVAAAPQGEQWLMLLYEDSTFSPRTPINELVAEYGRWADSLRGERRMVIGEKLASGRGTVVSDEFEDHPEALGELGGVEGLFIITAATEQEALAIARGMPHIRHNGRIVVRRIEPT